MATDKARRRRKIAALIEAGGIASQEALREALLGRGVDVTQATLSRDLREMGVLKGARGYMLGAPGASGAAGTNGSAAAGQEMRDGAREAERAIAEHVVAAAESGTLLVLRTGPGHAQPLGVALDAARFKQVVGTIAGDDTVFIATKSPADAKALIGKVRSLAGL